jgi:hypothetical protein
MIFLRRSLLAGAHRTLGITHSLDDETNTTQPRTKNGIPEMATVLISSLSVRKKPVDLLHVGLVDKSAVSQVSLTLGTFAGKNVAVVCLFPFDLPAFQDGEPLGRAPVRFQFSHP